MKRCWEIESTSLRIIAYNFDLHRVPDIVIYKRGAVLPEINLRHGHRAQAINWKNYNTQNHKSSTQATSNHRSSSSRCTGSLNDQLRIGRAEIDITLDAKEIAEAEFEKDTAPDRIEDIILDNVNDSEDGRNNSEVKIALIAQFTQDNAVS